MKIEIIEKCEPKELKLPCLMREKLTGVIIIADTQFNGGCAYLGTVIYTTESLLPRLRSAVGTRAEFAGKNLEIFRGNIKLSND